MTPTGGAGDKGTVVNLTPPAYCYAWGKAILHSFKGTDGAAPVAPVASDTEGANYRAAARGGSADAGAFLKLKRN